MFQIGKLERALKVWMVGWNMDEEMAHSEGSENVGRTLV